MSNQMSKGQQNPKKNSKKQQKNGKNANTHSTTSKNTDDGNKNHPNKTKTMLTNYKKLEIYWNAHQIVLNTYKLTQKFPQHEHNNLTSQLRRATTSLPLNIAEGSGARSYKIFLNYLIFCHRSSLETEAALLLAKDHQYITTDEYTENIQQLNTFQRKLNKYTQWIETKIPQKTPWQQWTKYQLQTKKHE